MKLTSGQLSAKPDIIPINMATVIYRKEQLTCLYMNRRTAALNYKF